MEIKVWVYNNNHYYVTLLIYAITIFWGSVGDQIQDHINARYMSSHWITSSSPLIMVEYFLDSAGREPFTHVISCNLYNSFWDEPTTSIRETLWSQVSYYTYVGRLMLSEKKKSRSGSKAPSSMMQDWPVSPRMLGTVLNAPLKGWHIAWLLLVERNSPLWFSLCLFAG